MTQSAQSATPMPQLESARLNRLYDELAFALGRTDRATLQAWGGRSAVRFVSLAGKRVSSLASLASRIGAAGKDELTGLYLAAREGRFGTQMGDRTAAVIDGSIAIGRDGARLVGGIGTALREDPKTQAPRVLAAFLGFYAGSGGVDGDGGIPDLDLLAGIDAHRSILTHSILAGVVAEGLLLAMVDLASQVHERLPVHRDPLWDRMAELGGPLTESLASGTSAGLSYHLMWDAVLEPAPYKDLPFSMPMEGHQTLMAANAVAEGSYVADKLRQPGPVTLHQGPPAEPSMGRKVVDGIARTAAHARERCRTMFGRFGKAPGG
ncbi:MAG: hypothetical protein FJ189_06850 [Gammaproteobacteria bacterium]|nr:hypothetical protein [Gammaproteobacteria bacterium]